MLPPGYKASWVEGKARLALLPGFGALKLVGQVATYGAKKYSRLVASCEEPGKALAELARYCTCGRNTDRPSATLIDGTQLRGSASDVTSPNTLERAEPSATPTELLMQELGASHAMSGNSGSETPDTRRGNVEISKGGLIETRAASLATSDNTASAQASSLETPPTVDCEPCPASAYRGRMSVSSSQNKEAVAPSAESAPAEPSTSTTITPPVSFGDFSAGAATKDSDSWATVLRVWREHSPTCGSRQRYCLRNDGLRTPDHNWRGAESDEHYLDALLRHVFAYLDGEDDDSESKLPHLAHAAWNALAILQLKLDGRCKDSRYKKEVSE